MEVDLIVSPNSSRTRTIQILARRLFPSHRFITGTLTHQGDNWNFRHALLAKDVTGTSAGPEATSLCGAHTTRIGDIRGNYFSFSSHVPGDVPRDTCEVCFERGLELYVQLDQAEARLLAGQRRGLGGKNVKLAGASASFADKHPAQAKLWVRALNFPTLRPDEVHPECDVDVEWRCTVREHPRYIEQPKQVAAYLRSTRKQRPCPLCRGGFRPSPWTREKVLVFVEAMLEHLERLTPADRYQLLLQTGLLESSGSWSSPVTEQLLRLGKRGDDAKGRIKALLSGARGQQDLRTRIGDELASIASIAGLDETLQEFVRGQGKQKQDGGREEAARRICDQLEGKSASHVLQEWGNRARVAEAEPGAEDPLDLLWRHMPRDGVDEFRQLLREAFPNRALESVPIEGLTTKDAVLGQWKASLETDVRTIDDADLMNSGAPGEGDIAEKKLVSDAVAEILATSDALFIASDDVEALEYFLASQLSKLWGVAFDDMEVAMQHAEKWSGTDFGNAVRDRFIEECVAVNSLQLPADWSFRPRGAPANAPPFSPRVMQKLTAVRLRDTERQGIGNWSLMGGGKTVSAILASDCLEAPLTMIVCPNATVSGWQDEIRSVFPAACISLDWSPPSGEGRRYIVLNIEKFQQPRTPVEFAALLEMETPRFVVLDEVHKFKQRDNVLKTRRQNLLAFLTMAKEREPSLRILGMSGTPVINNLFEARSLIELCTLKDHGDLEVNPTPANAMRVHARLATLGIRYRPNYLAEFDDIDRIRIDIGHRYQELLGKNLYEAELICLDEKTPAIVAHATQRTVIYSELVDGVHDRIATALRRVGRTVGFYNGDRKDGLLAYQRGECDCLIASQALGTGVDGLQACTDQLIVATLPWTSSDFDQLLGRFFRPKSDGTIGRVTVRVPWTFIASQDGKEGEWSMDRARWLRIRYKASLADAAVDGILPEGELRSPDEAHSDLLAWLKRLRNEGSTAQPERKDLCVPMPEAARERLKRAIGDLTAFHAKVASSNATTTHRRLESDPAEWFWYHTEVEEAVQGWPFVPRDRCIEHIKRRLTRRKALVVADIGCGLAKIADALSGSCTVHSFDHVAFDARVTRANVCERVPLPDETADVAVLSLVLDWQKDWQGAIAEASRVLALDGQLLVWETRGFVERAGGIEAFRGFLLRHSLQTIQVFDEHFIGFTAVKL